MADDAATVALINRIEADLRSLVFSEVGALRDVLVPVDLSERFSALEMRIADIESYVSEARAAAEVAIAAALEANEAAADANEAAADANAAADETPPDIADEIADEISDELPAALAAADEPPTRKRGLGWNDRIV